MDRRTIVAVFLCVLVYYGWMLWVQMSTPVPEPTEDGETAEATTGPDGTAPVAQPEAPPEPVAPVVPTIPESDLPVETSDFAACSLTGTWTSEGGVLGNVHLDQHNAPYKVTPLWQYAIDLVTGSSGDGGWKPYGDPPDPIRLLSEDAEGVAVGAGPLDAGLTRVRLVESAPDRVVLRGVAADGIEITRTIEAKPNADGVCTIDVGVEWRNGGPNAFAGPLWVGIFDILPPMYDRYNTPFRPTGMADWDVQTWSETHEAGCTPGSAALEAPYPYEGPVQWFGMTNAYFSAVLVPEHEDAGQLYHLPRSMVQTTPEEVEDAEQGGMKLLTGPRPVTGYGAAFVIDGELAAGDTRSEHFLLYMGPNEVETLRAVDDDLTSLVDFGMLSLFAWPLHWLLTTFYGFVGNWGLAIMTLTLLVKAVFFPLTQMAFKSSQRMQALQPQLQKVREDFKDNQEELNRRTMELFKENGVNPLGGCLPMVIQMPIWFALYQVLLYSVELYHTEFLFLKDLSSADPYCILPAIVVGLMLVQQRFMPTGNMSPEQARMMKLMPLVFGFFFFTFPSGLVLYIFVNMLLTIAQQWVIKRRFGQPVAPAPATA